MRHRWQVGKNGGFASRNPSNSEARPASDEPRSVGARLLQAPPISNFKFAMVEDLTSLMAPRTAHTQHGWPSEVTLGMGP